MEGEKTPWRALGGAPPRQGGAIPQFFGGWIRFFPVPAWACRARVASTACQRPRAAADQAGRVASVQKSCPPSPSRHGRGGRGRGPDAAAGGAGAAAAGRGLAGRKGGTEGAARAARTEGGAGGRGGGAAEPGGGGRGGGRAGGERLALRRRPAGRGEDPAPGAAGARGGGGEGGGGGPAGQVPRDVARPPHHLPRGGRPRPLPRPGPRPAPHRALLRRPGERPPPLAVVAAGTGGPTD